MSEQKIPKGPTIKKHCQDLGVWAKYLERREGLKLEGLVPREAAERAYVEMRIGELWADWRQRKTQSEILGKQVPLTPAEVKKVHPKYEAPSVTKGGEVGEAVLSLPEQIRWVKQQLARVRNGGEAPEEYPNADTLYWYQIALTRPADFDKIVLKIEAPEKDAEDLLMRDGEYQFGQIEKQLTEALKEVGEQLVEQEAGFAELFAAGSEAAA